MNAAITIAAVRRPSPLSIDADLLFSRTRATTSTRSAAVVR